MVRSARTTGPRLGETIGIARSRSGGARDVIGPHRLARNDDLIPLTLLLFFGSAILIYYSCEFFVNGVEWVGHRLRLAESTTGTVLAAFGTALPESVVTFVAVAF